MRQLQLRAYGVRQGASCTFRHGVNFTKFAKKRIDHRAVFRYSTESRSEHNVTDFPLDFGTRHVCFPSKEEREKNISFTEYSLGQRRPGYRYTVCTPPFDFFVSKKGNGHFEVASPVERKNNFWAVR